MNYFTLQMMVYVKLYRGYPEARLEKKIKLIKNDCQDRIVDLEKDLIRLEQTQCNTQLKASDKWQGKNRSS